MKNIKVILLDVPWDYQFGQQVRRGIFHYARPHLPWLFVNLQSYKDSKWMRPVGIISMRRPRDYMAIARRYGLAAVGVGAWSPDDEFSGLPYVDVNPKALGEMATDYFIERGFRNFGMIVPHGTFYSQYNTFHSPYRGEAFVEALRKRKLTCDVFDCKKKYPSCDKPALPAIGDTIDRTRRWLMSLPKPLAVFCTDDSMGVLVCGVCWGNEIRVPEEVAILGAGDDDMFCSMTWPHLSSIRVPAEQIGYEAAELLDAMLRGQKVPNRPILLPPLEVVTRQSTDVIAVDDRYVTRAVQFISEHACEGIRVENVMDELSLSRRPLERRFKSALGRSPFAEIRRVQIERVKTLLAKTDITLEAIAFECGFDSGTRVGKAFRKFTGTSPGAYRKQFRSR